MGTLFLSGGGDKKHTEKFDLEFKEQINHSKPLLYIPIAMKDEIAYTDCFQWVKSVFNPLGIQEIKMWTDVNQKSLSDLDQYSAIYIGGGNTFSLLNDMQKSNFDKILREYIISGGTVYGGSAGAIVLGSHIMTSAHLDVNHVGIRKMNGLNLIGNLAIWCHYENKNDELIKRYIKKYKKPVLALSEETGASVKEGVIKITGTKPAFLFLKEEKTDLPLQSEHNLYRLLK